MLWAVKWCPPRSVLLLWTVTNSVRIQNFFCTKFCRGRVSLPVLDVLFYKIMWYLIERMAFTSLPINDNLDISQNFVGDGFPIPP